MLFTFLLPKFLGLFQVVNASFIKWTRNLTFLTSFTYKLTPSTSNLVEVEDFWFKRLFTLRPTSYWGHKESWGHQLGKFFLKGRALRVHALESYFVWLSCQMRYLSKSSRDTVNFWKQISVFSIIISTESLRISTWQRHWKWYANGGRIFRYLEIVLVLN